MHIRANVLILLLCSMAIDYTHGGSDVKDDLPQDQSPPVGINFYTDKNGNKFENNQALAWDGYKHSQFLKDLKPETNFQISNLFVENTNEQ